MKKILIYAIIAFAMIAFAFANPLVDSLERNNGDIELYFCNYNDCELGLIDILKNSNEIICAFYDLDINITNLLDYNDKLLFDKKMKDDALLEKVISEINFKQQSSYMHHKFCVLDNKKILTGSMNPTRFGVNRNDNNFIIIESEILANNYLNEIKYLENEKYNKTNNIFIMNNFIMENYFCPRECNTAINRLLKLINLSQETIYVAAFSFTSEQMFTALLDAHERGVEVNIIMEKRMINSKSSKFDILKAYGINIIFDSNPGAMHHKFIVIDGEIVQFGSMNYSANGIENNNENILIIYNPAIAKAFIVEFERIWNLSI